MSQIVPPPASDQPPQPLALPPPEPDTERALAAVARLPAPPPPPTFSYEPEPPRRQPRVWRALKWPARKALKGIYLVGRTARLHKIVALVVLLLLLAFTAGGVVVYRIANPTPSIPISNANRPELPDSVHHWLHGFVTFNAKEMWDSLSPQMQATLAQQNATEASLQGVLDQNRSSNTTVEYQYTGGYHSAQGGSYFVVQVMLHGSNGSGELTWYFVVDDSTGKISLWQDISPQTTPTTSGQSGQSGQSSQRPPAGL